MTLVEMFLDDSRYLDKDYDVWLIFLLTQRYLELDQRTVLGFLRSQVEVIREEVGGGFDEGLLFVDACLEDNPAGVAKPVGSPLNTAAWCGEEYLRQANSSECLGSKSYALRAFGLLIQNSTFAAEEVAANLAAVTVNLAFARTYDPDRDLQVNLTAMRSCMRDLLHLVDPGRG